MRGAQHQREIRHRRMVDEQQIGLALQRLHIVLADLRAAFFQIAEAEKMLGKGEQKRRLVRFLCKVKVFDLVFVHRRVRTFSE